MNAELSVERVFPFKNDQVVSYIPKGNCWKHVMISWWCSEIYLENCCIIYQKLPFNCYIIDKTRNHWDMWVQQSARAALHP